MYHNIISKIKLYTDSEDFKKLRAALNCTFEERDAIREKIKEDNRKMKKKRTNLNSAR